MLKIVLPAKQRNKFHHIAHVRYVVNVFQEAGALIKFAYFPVTRKNTFPCLLNDKKCWFDFGDSPGYVNDVSGTCFKFHCHHSDESVFPFTPISFQNWKAYQKFNLSLAYTATGDTILNNQRSRAGAKKRRLAVRDILAKNFNTMDFSITMQEKWWEKISDCLVSVCVPGWSNHILDRGQLQQMAFGACTISPNLPIILPYEQRLQPGIHYLACKDDYSDLADVIRWCKENRSTCRTIGANAKKLFRDTSTPDKLIKWIESCISPTRQP